jgi:predicted RNA-binding protein Jag
MHVQDVDILKTPQSSTTEETTQTPDNQDDKKDDKVDNKVDEKTEVDILGENKAPATTEIKTSHPTLRIE